MLREQGRTNLALAAQQLETQRLQQQLLSNQLLASQPLQARISKSKEERILDEAFLDPSNPAQNIITQANGPERLPESKLLQAELNLDQMLVQKRISKDEYHQLSASAKALAARNWLAHDGQVNTDGTVTYRGVVMDAGVAPLVAYADAKRYWDKETHLSAQELGKAALDIAKGAYDFFIGDDLKTLSDPNATLFSKTLAAGSLTLMVMPGGSVARTIGKGALKTVAERTLARNGALIGAGLIGYAGMVYFSKQNDKTEDSPSDSEQPTEDNDCYQEYLRDIARCHRRFKNKPERFNRCASTATTRLGECLAGRGSTQLDIWPD